MTTTDSKALAELKGLREEFDANYECALRQIDNNPDYGVEELTARDVWAAAKAAVERAIERCKS